MSAERRPEFVDRLLWALATGRRMSDASPRDLVAFLTRQHCRARVVRVTRDVLRRRLAKSEP